MPSSSLRLPALPGPTSSTSPPPTTPKASLLVAPHQHVDQSMPNLMPSPPRKTEEEQTNNTSNNIGGGLIVDTHHLSPRAKRDLLQKPPCAHPAYTVSSNYAPLVGGEVTYRCTYCHTILMTVELSGLDNIENLVVIRSQSWFNENQREVETEIKALTASCCNPTTTSKLSNTSLSLLSASSTFDQSILGMSSSSLSSSIVVDHACHRTPRVRRGSLQSLSTTTPRSTVGQVQRSPSSHTTPKSNKLKMSATTKRLTMNRGKSPFGDPLY